MNNVSVYDELDRAIDQLDGPREVSDDALLDAKLAALLPVARDLWFLPRPQFKAQLKLELEWEAAGRSITADPHRYANRDNHGSSLEILSAFTGKPQRLYPLRGSNVAASAALHAALLLLLGTGLVTAHRAQILETHDGVRQIYLDEYVPPKGDGHESKGGGGDHSKTAPSKGELPPPSRIQFTPPVVEIQNTHPTLPMQATIIAPPNVNLPHDKPIGEALSTLMIPSGGSGIHGGIGTGSEGGIGSKTGPSVGDGDGPFNSAGVSAPRPIYHPEPEYSEEARRLHFQGVVSLLIVVERDGHPTHLRVMRSLGMGLDEKALEAVRTWRFEPGMKDGRPVPVLMEVEVDFRIH